MFLHSDQPL
ncbi:hypothetical protein ECEC1862_3406, partial [Escherichia coli EC1862]